MIIPFVVTNGIFHAEKPIRAEEPSRQNRSKSEPTEPYIVLRSGERVPIKEFDTQEEKANRYEKSNGLWGDSESGIAEDGPAEEAREERAE